MTYKTLSISLVILLTLMSCGGENSISTFAPTDIVGTWQEQGNNLQLKYKADNTHFYCSLNVPFELRDGGQTLKVGPSEYTRIAGANASSIVGHWSDGSEDIYYRNDGRSVSLFDNEVIVYFGTYDVTYSGNGGVKTDCDYRGQYSLSASTVEVRRHGNGVASYAVSIVPGQTLVVTAGVNSTTYNWVL